MAAARPTRRRWFQISLGELLFLSTLFAVVWWQCASRPVSELGLTLIHVKGKSLEYPGVLMSKGVLDERPPTVSEILSRGLIVSAAIGAVWLMCAGLIGRRVWPQFSRPWTLISALALAVLLFAWPASELRLARQRRVMLERLLADHRATVLPVPTERRNSVRISRFREWVGDFAVGNIWLPETSTDEDLAHTQHLFPESKVIVFEERLPWD